MHRAYRFDLRAALQPRATTRCGCGSTRPTSTPRRRRERLGAAADGLHRAVQLHPQDGLQLRLGLGPDRWSPPGIWQADRPAPLVGRPARRGPSTRDGDGRVGRVRGGDGGRGPRPARAAPARHRPTGGRDRRRRRAAGPGHGRSGPGRGRRCACAVADAGAVVAPRVRRAGPPPAGGDPADRGRRPSSTAGSARIGFRDGAARHQRRRARDAVHPGRQRRAGLRPRRQLDPGRRVPEPDHPRAAGRAARPGGRGERQPAAGLGRRPLRVGGLLRAGRRARAAGRAGLPVRLRGLPGGGAVRRARWRPRRASRSSGSRRHPSLVLLDRQQREHLGLRTTGTGRSRWPGAPGAPGYYFDLLPGIVAELDPTRPYWPGSPYSGRPRPAPERPGARHACTSGTCGTPTTTRTTGTTGRGSSPSSGTRRRRPTRRCAGRSATSRWPPTRPACGTTRRRSTATRSCTAAWTRTCRAPRDFDDWHYLTQLNQARAIQARGRALPVAAARAAWAPSSGSSTTAGR